MSGKKEVIIKLTDEQRRQIKDATGQDITELKVGTVEGRANPLAAGVVENRANPLSLAQEVENRANPMKPIDE